MMNGRGWRYPEDFRRMAVERFKNCENIEWLAKELGVPRQTLYRWHEENGRAEVGKEQPTEKSRESRLRREISDLKRLFAEKTLEVDFFKGALQKIEARHRESSGLASGHLRPHPGRNVAAGRVRYRTDVPPCRVE
jgi:transposase